jgi:hypothetical protein
VVDEEEEDEDDEDVDKYDKWDTTARRGAAPLRPLLRPPLPSEEVDKEGHTDDEEEDDREFNAAATAADVHSATASDMTSSGEGSVSNRFTMDLLFS